MKWTRPSASSKRIGRSFCQIRCRQTVKWICMKKSLREAISWTMGSGKRITRFYMFFMRCQMLSDQMRKEQYSDYIGDNLYTIWELVLKSEFTSLSYDNHIYAMYSNDGGTSMVLIYSPIEERFVGFSLKY